MPTKEQKETVRDFKERASAKIDFTRKSIVQETISLAYFEEKM